ncbi:nuclear transport factor 2 family protein [Umezawaea endophytica]|uniref:Nuclear transport factor 2 family protein n=1 Tax=Umezawaea endophytica TaxID=1654476 RepID=A0A9X2VYM0_9PSEU|nr:nuclear transport factor 2 family protein [Umezawaea endophytica]MCS7484118.1 nuclear transport factor 2 family protein [Umezawaea endophytica]
MSDSVVLRELNEHVWLAYRDAYQAGDAAAFLALHEPGLIRAGGPVKRVVGFADYALETTQWFDELAERGDSVVIAFRFVERITDGVVASERGVYRLVAGRASGESKVLFGRFHVFSRRSEGRWRVVVDYDSDERGTVTVEDYESATPLDDVSEWDVG